MPILHLARSEDWDDAVVRGEYRVSTLGATLDDVGFLHASTPGQLAGTARRFYGDVVGPLVVLVLDEPALAAAGVPVRYEAAADGQQYPHVFGALRPAFVADVRPARIDPVLGLVVGCAPIDYLAALVRDAAAFAEVIATADLATPVPACPGWTLHDLASHLGGVHRWAEHVVATGERDHEPAGPAGRSALHAWFVEGAGLLVDRLAAVVPETPAWTFGPPPRRAGFWRRRQAHETSMHLGDALRALGVDPVLDPAFAADGIAEVATVFFPRQVRLGRMPPLPRGIRVEVSDDLAGPFVIAGDGTDAAASTQATVRGPSTPVLQVLWGRADAGALDVDGDPAVVREVLSAGITP
jgi:uncharacterized protein (TIGR03083 family)